MNSKIALLTVASIGTAGGVGGIGYWYSIPKDLKEVLIKEGKKLLDVSGNTNDSDWKKLAENHQSSEEKIIFEDNTEITKISGFNITIPNNNLEPFQQLKNQCKKLFETPVSKESVFETAKKDAINWCTQGSYALTKKIKSSSASLSTGVRSAPEGDSRSQQQSVVQASAEPNSVSGQAGTQLPSR